MAGLQSVRPEPRSDTKAVRILLAEDDPDFRIFLSFALEHEGYEVLEARNGTELAGLLGSLYLQEQQPVDVIVSDVRMPGLDILGVLDGFRRWWKTPWILMTAFGDELFYDEARRVGASFVLDKPFPVEELRSAIVALIPPVHGEPAPESGQP